MIFIELTTEKGDPFIVNMAYIERVCLTTDNVCCIILNSQGILRVEQSYQEIIEKLDARLAKVNRLPNKKKNT